MYLCFLFLQSTQNYIFMFTIVSTGLLGLATLFVGAFEKTRWVIPFVIIGLLGIVGLHLSGVELASFPSFSNMIVVDGFATGFSAILLFITLGLFFFADYIFRNEEEYIADIYGLMLFALCGAMIMVSYTNLTMLFLGVEILSIPMYILAGSRRVNIASNEASIKYFMMGAFASAIMLFGITFIFGATNSLDMQAILLFVKTTNQPTTMFHVGILLVIFGFLFKIGAAPFHFWSPDVYQGSPIFITVFMSTIVKIAAVGAFYKFITTIVPINSVNPLDSIWFNVLWISAALSFIIANLSAVGQTDIKRIMAFSSVSHAGFLLLPILAANTTSADALFYYVSVYSVASILFFGVLMLVAETKNELTLEDIRGLGIKSPFLVGCMVVALLSMAGIPPFAGFFAKFFTFKTAMDSSLNTLVIIGILGSLVGVYYYFKIFLAAIKKPLPKTDTTPIHVPLTYTLMLGMCILFLIVVGLFPEKLQHILHIF